MDTLFGAAIVGVVALGCASAADALFAHRLSSALAVEAASETIAACANRDSTRLLSSSTPTG